jgi:hypothetical protein
MAGLFQLPEETTSKGVPNPPSLGDIFQGKEIKAMTSSGLGISRLTR